MRSNTRGDAFRITTFGESHGPAVGVVIDGVAPGLALEESMVQAQLDRRRPGRTGLDSPRAEPDRAEILSGVFEGRTTGAPVCILVRNVDARPGDYERFRDLVRPGHGDAGWLAKYGVRDWRGGGRLSGRETVGRVAAGAVARRLLAERSIAILGAVVEIDGIRAGAFDAAFAESDPLRCADPAVAAAMADRVRQVRDQGDSVGGIVEVRVDGVPPGLGDPVFRRLDADLASALMSIGGVRGVEIGDGFAAARMRGSTFNDSPMPGGGFSSNHAGGLLAGISTGQVLVLRLAVRPTASISRRQATVDLQGRPASIEVRGRHDPCLCLRIVPVAEAMVACVLADAMLRQASIAKVPPTPDELRLEIDRCDDALLAALAHRVHVTAQMGTAKGTRVPGHLSRPAAGAALRRAWARRARELGLPRDVALSVLEAIGKGGGPGRRGQR